MITKEGDEGFDPDEIFSIGNISYSDREECGGYGPVTIDMKSGQSYSIDFSEIEGSLQL